MAASDQDFELIRRAQAGERDAFEALLRDHYDLMYRMAYRWCGNKADAEDITQTACIKLARALASFRFRSAFTTWLYTLVINTAKDWAKARGRKMDGLDSIDEPATPAGGGEDRIFAVQILSHVRKLPEKEREALHLVFSAGMSHREAAEAMACKESTVSWYIHEARKKLQIFQNAECRHG